MRRSKAEILMSVGLLSRSALAKGFMMLASEGISARDVLDLCSVFATLSLCVCVCV